MVPVRKVRKITVTNPDAMAQKNKEEPTNPDDLQQARSGQVCYSAEV
jgi:hypothetical protein